MEDIGSTPVYFDCQKIRGQAPTSGPEEEVIRWCTNILPQGVYHYPTQASVESKRFGFALSLMCFVLAGGKGENTAGERTREISRPRSEVSLIRQMSFTGTGNELLVSVCLFVLAPRLIRMNCDQFTYHIAMNGSVS